MWPPDPKLQLKASYSPPTCSVECLLSPHMYSISTIAGNTMPNGLLNICYPWPFFCFTNKASRVARHWYVMQPAVDWAHPFGRRWTSGAFRQSGFVSADPSRDGLLTKKRDALCRCGALTLEEQKSVLPLCSQGLCNDWSSQRAKCHSVLAAFLLGHRVSWPPLRCFLGSGLKLIQSSNDSGTIQVS